MIYYNKWLGKLSVRNQRDLEDRVGYGFVMMPLKVLMNKPVSKLLYRHKFREVNNSTVHVNFAISLLVLI